MQNEAALRLAVQAPQRREQDAGVERRVADYIAGMTDRFALREHERLTGQRLFAA
jgi:dGTPase